MDKGEIVNEYVTISKQIEQLEKRKKALHKSIIDFRAHGIEFDEGIEPEMISEAQAFDDSYKDFKEHECINMSSVSERCHTCGDDPSQDCYEARGKEAQ